MSAYFIVRPDGSVVAASHGVNNFEPEFFLREGIEAFDQLFLATERHRWSEALSPVMAGHGEIESLVLTANGSESGEERDYLAVTARQIRYQKSRHLLIEVREQTAIWRETQELLRREKELRLFQEIAALRHRTTENETFYQQVLELMADMVEADAAFFYLAAGGDPAHQHLLATSGVAKDKRRLLWKLTEIPQVIGRTDRVILTREPLESRRGRIVSIFKKFGYVAKLRVPVTLQGERLGTIVLASLDLTAFSWQQIGLVSRIADYLSIIVATERLGQEREEAAAVTRGILAQTSDGLFIINHHGMVMEYNPAFASALNQESPRRFKLTAAVEEKKRPATVKFIARLVKDSQAKTRIRWQFQPEKTFEVTGSRIISYGRADHYLCVARDISNLLDRQDVLQQRNLELKRVDRMKDEFISLVSHELRSPLTVLKGNFSLLEGKFPVSERAALSAMRRHLDRLDRLVADVLDVTKLEYGGISFYPTDFSLVTMIDQVHQAVRPGLKRKKIKWQTDIQVGGVRHDQDRLTQVLTNLVENAIKNLEDGGVIRITAHNKRQWLILKVTDTGRGLTATDKKRLFERFYKGRESRAGMGLGLYIVQKLVKRMRGSITVTSRPRRGATFTVNVPLRLSE